MVLRKREVINQGPVLSVLALSSRFDGQSGRSQAGTRQHSFQYSLCRVVLMVTKAALDIRAVQFFQYSLCRVVLMVTSVPTAAQR